MWCLIRTSYTLRMETGAKKGRFAISLHTLSVIYNDALCTRFSGGHGYDRQSTLYICIVTMRYALQILPLEITETKHSSMHVRQRKQYISSRTACCPPPVCRLLEWCGDSSASTITWSTTSRHEHTQAQCRSYVVQLLFCWRQTMEKQPARSFGMPVRLGAKQDSSSDSITRRSEARECRVISRAQHFVQRAASSDVISETVIEAITSSLYGWNHLWNGGACMYSSEDRSSIYSARRWEPQHGDLHVLCRSPRLTWLHDSISFRKSCVADTHRQTSFAMRRHEVSSSTSPGLVIKWC